MSRWDDFYLGMADYVSTKSKDPSTKVGCVIVRPDNSVASVGYNGFPRGVNDSPELLADRDTKLSRTIHAEVNAVLNSHERLDGCSVYVTHPPCSNCAAVLIQAGVIEVISRRPDNEMTSKWGESWKQAAELFTEAGVLMGER